jgi:RNA polymerase sigma-70 factor (ECF subfamily)
MQYNEETMSKGEVPDEELIDLIAHRDPDAVRVLYGRYGRMVYGLSMQVIGDAATAEEVCQDVFMRVWEKSGTYRPDRGKVVTWIARIARNRAIDVLRSQRSRGLDLPRPGTEPHEAANQESADASLKSAYGEDPGDRLWQSFREQEVREAVAALPRDQRHALSLAFFQGLTHREIAEMLGEPLGTVKTRIRDAMAKLRSSLGTREGT